MNLQDFIASTKQSVTLLTLHTSCFYCCTIAEAVFYHLSIQLYTWDAFTLCVTPLPSVKLMHSFNEVYYTSKDYEFVTIIKELIKNNLFFQCFLMPLVCAMVLSFTFRQVIKLKSVWPTAKTTVIFIGPISIMIHLAVYTCPMDTYSSKMY